MQPALPPPVAASGVESRPGWARGLLAAILAVAFLLRMTGASYGLPDWVYHSDTPKQLGRVVPFLPEHFLRGRYRATFRVRGAAPAAAGPIARLEVIRHLPGRGYDSIAFLDWTPESGTGAWEEVVLPFATDLEPVDLELQVHYHGHGTLDVDRTTVVPDVRAVLAERLAGLAPAGLPAAPTAPR